MLPTHPSYDFMDKFHRLFQQGRPFVSVLLVDVRGSTPQEQGAKMLVTLPPDSAPYAGTIGGGRVELKAIHYARDLLQNPSGKSRDFVTWNLQKDVGMTCGGEVKLYFETYFAHGWEIVIFGAGHVSQALIPLLLTLNCQITCIDSRQEWLDKLPNSPALKRVHAEQPATLVDQLPERAFILSMTQGHATDFPILKEVLSTRQPPYLGVIGSRSKAHILHRELLQAGLTEEQIKIFFCPIGLPLGDSTPPEMAVSIAAQLLQERDRIFKSPPN